MKILIACLWGGPLLCFGSALVLSEETARFDLFGRRVDSEAIRSPGELPETPMKVVVDANAPRFGSTASRPRWVSRGQRRPRAVKLFRIGESANREEPGRT